MSNDIKPDADSIVNAYAKIDQMRDEADIWENELEMQLAPYINAYERIEAPGCGSQGGWEFDRIEGSVVYLKHECFYAHRYDMNDKYVASVNIDALLALTPKDS